MSYDITIAADERCSQSLPFEVVRRTIQDLPGIQPNGSRGFLLELDNRLWMEIDLEMVSEEGDALEGSDESPTINCVNLHILYPKLGEHPERDYFPTALSIAHRLGWAAIDQQTDEPLRAEGSTGEKRASGRPWWKFW